MTQGEIPRGEESRADAVHPRRLAAWWIDDPRNPGRTALDNPVVRSLAAQLAPGSGLRDLGGTMSLNVHLESADLVLRVHPPFVTRRRLEGLQAVRRALANRGLPVPVPVRRGGATIFHCGDRFAELESYLSHVQPRPTYDSYVWLFAAIGRLHQALATLDVAVPRPVVATYAPPGSAARWLRMTEAAIAEAEDAANQIRRARDVLRRLRRRWIPARRLPCQLVHGDMRLGNVCLSPTGEIVFLDFGFLAQRPRIHDLAYAIAFMLLALQPVSDPAIGWTRYVPRMLQAYESAANAPLSPLEREGLVAYTAAVPLYFLAIAGLNNDPVGQVRGYEHFLMLSEWLLTREPSL